MKRNFLLFVCLVPVFLSCSSGGPSNEVKIDGSSTVFPITEAVAEEFRAEAPEVRVTVGVSGTGGGFKKFLRGDTDINDASRAIQPVEMAEAESTGVEYVQLSVAYDGLAVVVHPDNDWADYFTVQELKKLWEPAAQGTISRWSQLRDGWPDEEIHLFGPGVASGTYDYFTEAIVGESGASRGDFTASEDDNVLVQGVATDDHALGFFGLAYYEENMDKLQLAGVKNGNAPVVKPSMQTVADGSYAPLSRPLYVYVSSKAAARQNVQKFVRFYLNNASTLAREIGYVPMPDSMYAKQLQKFEQFAERHSSASDGQ